MQWFRYYHDALDNLKVQQLPPVTFKHWVNLLCLANQGTPRGRLPEISVIAFRLRLSDAKAKALIDELAGLRLLDFDADGNVTPHDWQTRQAKSDDVTSRVVKHREGVSRNVAGNVSRNGVVTPRAHEELDTDTDTEKIPPNGGLTPPQKPLPEHGPAQQIVAEYCRIAGIGEPSNYGRAAGIAQKLVNLGISIADIEPLYAFAADKSGKSDLNFMLSAVDRWRAKAVPANGRASPNGSHCPYPVPSRKGEDWERLRAGMEPAWGSAQGGIDTL